MKFVIKVARSKVLLSGTSFDHTYILAGIVISSKPWNKMLAWIVIFQAIEKAFCLFTRETATKNKIILGQISQL